MEPADVTAGGRWVAQRVELVDLPDPRVVVRYVTQWVEDAAPRR